MILMLSRWQSREAVIWRQLSHPNLLPFYGVYRSSGTVPRVCLVSPWMQNGNIIQYLEKAPTATRRPLITDVAEGLHYLHTFEPPVIHGDLKGANIFITPSLRACVADFGLTSLESDSQGSLASTSTTSGIGSLLWTAPELLNYRTGERQRQTLTTDMYSFGCVCYEIYTGSPKFASLSVTRIILAVTEGRPVPRPPHPELDETTWDIIQQCWSLVPNSRPTTLEVIQMLSTDTISTTRKEPISEWNEDMMWQLHSKFEGNSSDTIASSGRYSRNLTESLRSYSQQSQDSASVMTQTTSSNSLRDFTTNSHWENRSGMITSHDMIIAVMGPTGTGKSTFIDEATRGQGPVIGHSLDSCTRYVQTFTCAHPRQHGRNVVFVDTPGFDDSQRTDYEILEEIAKWLETTYKQRITLSGLLYFHAISDSRMRGAPLRNLAMFKELCGENALQNVILTTTMWDEVPTAVGVRHEEQLRDEFWEPMISAGCRMARFSRSWESAWDIIDKLDISTRQPIQLQIQMVDNGWKLHQTSAYAALARIWEDMIAKFRDLLRKKDGDPAVLRPLLRSAEGQKKALDRHSVSQASFASSVTLVMSKSHRFRTNKKT
ncbi:kinase-like domain-containing protein [Hygrophoropsis aurantiaca]|uniref:Kinase-like domain-containing protein n=1 Tax=Hygrophoropsis aurantiaca TaxID=72124 RepID=A0ACB8A7G1_9AGAM|nr:kinase-like domain-containing protein [Hygrophoropsis aurantiaca]